MCPYFNISLEGYSRQVWLYFNFLDKNINTDDVPYIITGI